MLKIIIFLVLLIPSVSLANEQQIIKIQPGPEDGKDTYFGIGSVGGHLGRPDSHAIRVGGWGDRWVTYLQFDLSTIPENAEIVSAELGLYNFSLSNVNEGKVFLVTEPWLEADPNINDSPTYVDLGSLYFPISNVPSWSTTDVTSYVQEWVSGVVPNYGWRIEGKYTTSNRAKEFYSSDYLDNPTLRPYLEITYTVPEEEEVTVETGVAKLQDFISGLFSKAQQNSYVAQVKNILNFFETGKFEATLSQLAALLKKINADTARGELPSDVSEDMTEVVVALEETVNEAAAAEGEVPLMTQIASPYPPESASWADDLYGDGTPDWCGNTIGGCGCALTSLAMLGRYYGITKGYDGSEVNPGNFNAWLQSNNGYTELNTIRWYYGLQYLSSTLGFSALQLDALNSTNMSEIKTAVAAGAPSIAFKKSKGHYFVLSDVFADGNYAVRDPFWYMTQTLNDQKDIANNVQGYGGTFDQANLYSHSNAPRPFPRWVEIQLGSPAELLITDSQGRRTGYDKETGEIVNEIPGSTYAQAAGVVSQDVIGSDVHLPKVLAITAPEDDLFTLEVIGTGTGEYTLSVDTGGGYGYSEITTSEDNTAPGQVDTYVIDVPERQSSERAVATLRSLANEKAEDQPTVAEQLRAIADRLVLKNIAVASAEVVELIE